MKTSTEVVEEPEIPPAEKEVNDEVDEQKEKEKAKKKAQERNVKNKASFDKVFICSITNKDVEEAGNNNKSCGDEWIE